MVTTRRGTDTTNLRTDVGRGRGRGPRVTRVAQPFDDSNINMAVGTSMRKLVLTGLPEAPLTYPDLVNRDEDPSTYNEIDDLAALPSDLSGGGSAATTADRKSSSGLTSTKGLQDHDYDLPPDLQCTNVVHVPGMLDDLLSETEDNLDHLAFRRIKMTDIAGCEFTTAVHPRYTRRHAPRRINSENDVVSRVKTSLTGPAVYTSAVCNAKELKDPKDAPGGEPFFCSEEQKGNAISDLILLESEHSKAKPKLRVEIKVDRVLQVFPSKNDPEKNIFLPILMASGKPVEFVWPTKANPVPDEGNGKKKNAPSGHSTLTKVIVQVWQQLLKTAQDTNDPDGGVGILTSYTSTFFFVRRKNTLFISDRYTVKGPVLLAFIAVISKALGFCKNDFALPRVNTSRRYATRGNNFKRSGLDINVYENTFKSQKLRLDTLEEEDEESEEEEDGEEDEENEEDEGDAEDEVGDSTEDDN